MNVYLLKSIVDYVNAKCIQIDELLSFNVTKY